MASKKAVLWIWGSVTALGILCLVAGQITTDEALIVELNSSGLLFLFFGGIWTTFYFQKS